MIKAEVCTRISFNSQKWGIIWGTRNKKRLADICKGVLNGVDEISPLQSLISFRRTRLASCRCRGDEISLLQSLISFRVDEISLVPRLFSCRCRGGPCKLVWRLKARTASGFLLYGIAYETFVSTRFRTTKSASDFPKRFQPLGACGEDEIRTRGTVTRTSV